VVCGIASGERMMIDEKWNRTICAINNTKIQRNESVYRSQCERKTSELKETLHRGRAVKMNIL